MTFLFKLKLEIILLLTAAMTSCVLIRPNKFKKSLKKTALISRNFNETIKFNYKTWIYIKAKINNSEKQDEFIFDTGSPCTFSFKTKNDLKLVTKRLFHLGSYKVDYGFTNAEIGNIKYDNLAFLIMDHGLFNRPNTAGIIGVNAVQSAICEINFKDTTITISDTISNFKNITNAYKIKFKPLSSQQTPVIKLLINSKDTITAFIDTGEPEFIQFNQNFDLKMVKSEHPESVKTKYGNVNQQGSKVKKDSIYEVSYVKLNSIKLGDLELNSPIIRRESYYKGKNLVGLDFLQNFIVTIDWVHQDLYLKSIQNIPPISNISTYGFECYKFKGVLKVAELYKGSLAEKLGIKCGDEILEINNQDVQKIDKHFIEIINNPLPNDMEILIKFKNKDKEINLKKTTIF